VSRLLKYTLLALTLLPFAARAQQAVKPLQFNWKVTNIQRTIVSNPLLVRVPSRPVLQPIKYTLPKAAIFCRMEDAVYKHAGFIFKIRMGCDDAYSN
jgi:hypothetical protein